MLVERALVDEGTSRQEVGREAFLERVWQWKNEKGGYITGQMRRLGASADWSREKFTLEPQMSDRCDIQSEHTASSLSSVCACRPPLYRTLLSPIP
jgi:valyl-tRNA synthetase